MVVGPAWAWLEEDRTIIQCPKASADKPRATPPAGTCKVHPVV